ncbi:hypothetical protein [Sphingopyxis sp. GW247-27LB]|uniref:hypothetical protein n=1 Tax=Sphingopyxis sp. GW247-27LB TaxID=2012632 RepID=UPI000BA68F1F|nr:hypothetical protein [Sphingopyxis sp. GW247-27LB]PAL23591.1 hypothetical protein CD928_05855 [Sphingopyxis sp. GW247-27LB]
MIINPNIISEVADTLTDIETRAIGELDTFYGHGPGHLASNLQISISEARDTLRSLRAKGIVAFGHLMDEDEGMMRGKGYWLDNFGKAVRKFIGLDPCDMVESR